MTTDPKQLFSASRFGVVVDATPITLGMSGAAVYAVTTTNGSYILRVDRPEHPHWEALVRWQTLASLHEVAPKVELIDKAARAVVTARIEGVPFARAVAEPAARARALASLAEQLRRLHAIPLPPAPAKEPVAMARALWGAQKPRAGFPSWALPLEATIAEVEHALATDGRRVLGHGDPNPANMIWDGRRVWLVDWENAGPAHPYFDAAIAANFLALSPDDGVALLAAQEQRPADAADARLFTLLRRFAYAVYGVAFLSLVRDLAAAGVPSREAAPELRDVYARLARGELALSSAEAQVQFASALLREGMRG
jgi:thiamine kinase-like enzyme